MSPQRQAAYVDYQQRAAEFAVGDLVYPFLMTAEAATGRVVAVYPAIGMADVEWPHGTERVPVEDLQRTGDHATYQAPSVDHNNIPGGAGTVSVPGGPVPQETGPEDLPGPGSQFTPGKHAAFQPRRVAEAWVKRALYWASKDRHYRATNEEITSSAFTCPKCKKESLREATYKRAEGVSDRLLACPKCLFLIKRCDIIGHPEYVDDEAAGKQPFARIRLTASQGVG